MLFELPLWFAPSFYELDFSEIPVLICAFAMGRGSVATELCKVLLKLVLKGKRRQHLSATLRTSWWAAAWYSRLPSYIT